MKNKYVEFNKLFFKYKDKIYIFFLVIYIFSSLMSEKFTINDVYIFAFKCVKYLSLIPILYKIIVFDIKYYSKKTMNTVGFVLVVIAINIFFTKHYRTMLRYLVLILGSYGIDLKKVLTNYLIIEFFVLFFALLLCFFGIIPNYLYYKAGVPRYSLGFGWPTYPALLFFTVTCLYLYLGGKKIKFYHYLILLLINVLIFLLTNTRFEFLCSVVAIIFSLLYKYNNSKKLNSLLINIAKFILPFFTIISLILAYVYTPTNTFLYKINDISSNRLLFMSNAIKDNGISIVGKNVDWNGQSERQFDKSLTQNVVDNGYINVIINYGLLFLLGLEYLYYKLIIISKKENVLLSYMIIILAIHTFVNPQLLQIVYNPFLLLLVIPITYNDKKYKKLVI